MTDPTSPASIARADERRRPEGIEDESLVDHILDQLHGDREIYHEPVSGQTWARDMHTVVERVIDMALERAAQHAITTGFRTEARKDARAGMYEAVRLMQEVPR